MTAFIKSETQYIATGTIARVGGFVGIVTASKVTLDKNGVAGFPVMTIESPARSEVKVVRVTRDTVIEIPAP